ncbi:sensor histidine kinase [Pseudonocardia sp. CA-107938]|uniref:sensor histidine kinase n=1 Tax=Pseudonocardia sp. CA-107938 TaxID=3240021 RepID=UPI003D8FCA4C
MSVARWSFRARLTAGFGVLFLVAGAALLLVTYVLVAHALPGLGIEPPARPPVPALPGMDLPDVPDIEVQVRADDLWLLRVASVIGLLLMAVVSAGLAWLIAGRVLRPLRTMTSAVTAITSGNLHARLAMAGPRDEIADLADTFDGLLGRLEAAFEAQRRFVANASHELRSPLTFERSLLEVTLADPDPAAARAACVRLLENNHHQETIIEALLTLARSQRGLQRREPVDLTALTARLIDEAEPADVRVRAELRPAVVAGDAALLERLVRNLLDNAVRHNDPGGQVQVQVDGSGLRVRNTGPVVPPGQVEYLVQPFRRLDDARMQGRAGVGLGLSIVAAVADAHDAALTVTANPGGGLTVAVRFPACDQPATVAATVAPSS